MAPLLKKLASINWLLVVLMYLLLGFGLYAIYSATWMREADYLVSAWRKQAVWIAIGTVFFFVTALIHYKYVIWAAIPIYVSGLIFLVLTRFFGKIAGGARSWLEVGPLNFQPSQIALLGGILVLALILSKLVELHPLIRIGICGAVVAVPCLLIVLQPDLGSAIVWIPVFMIMLFLGGIQMRYIILLCLLGALMLPIVYYFGLQEYQQARITTFLNPDLDPQGDAWTINQSLNAIGSGGWDGKGFKAPNTLNEMGFLPSTIVHNDFIFAVIAEQHGFLGGTLLLISFALLLLTMLFIGFFARDRLGVLLVAGITGVVFTHVLMNIGMTISVTPITGLPLPFISYGGTFALLLMFCFGLIQSVWIHRKEAPDYPRLG